MEDRDAEDWFEKEVERLSAQSEKLRAEAADLTWENGRLRHENTKLRAANHIQKAAERMNEMLLEEYRERVRRDSQLRRLQHRGNNVFDIAPPPKGMGRETKS